MNHFDAIVIGGGPSGSTTGALLAEQGHRVLLLERDVSTLPHRRIADHTWFISTGLAWSTGSGSAPKSTACSVSITALSQPFYFFKTIRHECAQTWQIWRGEFDQMLLDNAASKGVRCGTVSSATC
jgi:flavin-dependent dehydrogenase